MFAQALANRLAGGGVHPASAPPMIARLLLASLVALFPAGKPEDVGLAGFARLVAAIAVWLADRMRGARERLVEARA